MTPLEMATACIQALNEPGVTGVVLTVPKGKTPRGFPRGEVLNEVRRNGVVERTSSYNAERVLTWLATNGLVALETEGDQIKITDLSGEGAPAATGKEGGA